MGTVIHPPTKGLLVSMAIRYDHSYGAPKQFVAPGLSTGFNDSDREALIDQVYDLYVKLTAKDVVIAAGTDTQLFAEISGSGYYSPKEEPYYAARWPEGYVPSRFVPAEAVAPDVK